MNILRFFSIGVITFSGLLSSAGNCQDLHSGRPRIIAPQADVQWALALDSKIEDLELKIKKRLGVNMNLASFSELSRAEYLAALKKFDDASSSMDLRNKPLTTIFIGNNSKFDLENHFATLDSNATEADIRSFLRTIPEKNDPNVQQVAELDSKIEDLELKIKKRLGVNMNLASFSELSKATYFAALKKFDDASSLMELRNKPLTTIFIGNNSKFDLENHFATLDSNATEADIRSFLRTIPEKNDPNVQQIAELDSKIEDLELRIRKRLGVNMSLSSFSELSKATYFAALKKFDDASSSMDLRNKYLTTIFIGNNSKFNLENHFATLDSNATEADIRSFLRTIPDK